MFNDESFARWMSFSVSGTTLIMLEKKDCPEHIQKLDNIDCAVTLQSLLVDLQDIGEVAVLS